MVQSKEEFRYRINRENALNYKIGFTNLNITPETKHKGEIC